MGTIRFFEPLQIGENGEVIFPCHTGSATGSSVPCTTTSYCSGGYGYGVYIYKPGKFLQVSGGSSSCGDGGTCAQTIPVTGAHKYVFDTIWAFDPQRRYLCCCTAPPSQAHLDVRVEFPNYQLPDIGGILKFLKEQNAGSATGGAQGGGGGCCGGESEKGKKKGKKDKKKKRKGKRKS